MLQGADVVVHLAFLITGTASRATTRAINVDGTLNAVRAAAGGGRQAVRVRCVGRRLRLPSRQPRRSDRGLARAARRAPVLRPGEGRAEHLLHDEIAAHHDPLYLGARRSWSAHTLGAKDVLPGWLAPVGRRLVGLVGRLARARAGTDPRRPLQLVHEDDVGRALVQCIVGAGPPGAYNIAGDGVLSAWTWRGARPPAAAPAGGVVRTAARAVAALPDLPFVPPATGWAEVSATPRSWTRPRPSESWAGSPATPASRRWRTPWARRGRASRSMPRRPGHRPVGHEGKGLAMTSLQHTSYEIAGRTVTMPCVVRDASAGTAMFDVDIAAARARVPHPFEPIETAPGRCQVAIAVIDYHDNDLGDYHEVGVTFFVTPTGGPGDAADREAGTFITRLPVDQSFTCEAGRTIWGFPRRSRTSPSTTPTTRSPARCAWTVGWPCARPCRGRRRRDAALPLVTYSLVEVPHRTAFTQGGGSQVLAGGEGVVLELGDHPGRELAALARPPRPRCRPGPSTQGCFEAWSLCRPPEPVLRAVGGPAAPSRSARGRPRPVPRWPARTAGCRRSRSTPTAATGGPTR